MMLNELQTSIDGLDIVPMTSNFVMKLRKFPEKFYKQSVGTF